MPYFTLHLTSNNKTFEYFSLPKKILDKIWNSFVKSRSDDYYSYRQKE